MIGPNHIKDVNVPRSANLLNHRFRSVPSNLVGSSWIILKVRTGAEEESGERNENKGDEDGPRVGKPLKVALTSVIFVIKPSNYCAYCNEYGTNKQHIPQCNWSEPNEYQ